MKRLIPATMLALFITQAEALDFGTLKDALKSTGNSNATTSTSSGAGVSSLSNDEASSGLKEALTQGVGKAVGTLGAADGFFGNKEVKIPLPKSLKKIEKGMKLMGMGKQSDELVLKMNRAAEAAVPEAKALLVGSIKQMTLADAKAILTGPQDAATQYF